MILWRVWDDDDMALSDSYFVTRADALVYARQSYDVPRSAFRPDDTMTDTWRAEPPAGSGCAYVYLERLYIQPTRAGIAHALKHIPHR
jgi:hypothetical protein